MVKKEICVVVGGGDVGQRLLPWLLPRFRVIVASRFRHDKPHWQGVSTVRLDLDEGLDCAPRARALFAIASVFIVLVPPLGLRMSRLLALLPPQARVVLVSTTGVYGDARGAWLREGAPPPPLNQLEPRAQARLHAETLLRAWARRGCGRVSIVRVAGIYGKPQAALPPAFVLTAQEDVFINHIHVEDVAQVVYRALWRGAPQRLYHAVDDSAMQHGPAVRLRRAALGLEPPLALPRQSLEERLSPQQMRFLAASRRLENRRMKEELGVKLLYPRLEDGYQEGHAASQGQGRQ